MSIIVLEKKETDSKYGGSIYVDEKKEYITYSAPYRGSIGGLDNANYRISLAEIFSRPKTTMRELKKRCPALEFPFVHKMEEMFLNISEKHIDALLYSNPGELEFLLLGPDEIVFTFNAARYQNIYYQSLKQCLSDLWKSNKHLISDRKENQRMEAAKNG